MENIVLKTIKDRVEIDKLLRKKVEIEIEVSKEEHYSTKILQILANTLYIEMPPLTIGKKSRHIILNEQEELYIILVTNEGIFRFCERIHKVVVDVSKPYFIVNIPNVLELMQRRTHNRISINIPINMKQTCINKNIKKEVNQEELCKVKEFKGVSINMSGGGLFVLAVKELNEGDIVLLEFDMPSKIEYSGIVAEVRRKNSVMSETTKSVRYGYGLSFVDIPEKSRNEILEYLDMLDRTRKETEEEVRKLLGDDE